jgi:hypothetical protein
MTGRIPTSDSIWVALNKRTSWLLRNLPVGDPELTGAPLLPALRDAWIKTTFRRLGCAIENAPRPGAAHLLALQLAF